ncbi:Protein BTN1 [Durusdinium trenchii]|uniref:Protein BTN1 n=1 Tax=Durusdinium trenchii TaxID=1381693 RepID=A0ABP0J2N2_9DINO
MKDRFRIYRDVIAFWILGLLNNFLYVTMNAGAENINEAGIALVYLANILPTLLVKLTGPYWFHYVSYRCRMNFIAILMVFCLCIVAWGDSTSIKLLGVAICSLASGVGEASLLAMASFYETKPCLAAWSSGTGFAGIAGYAWSLAFDAMNTCFQVQLMVALWIPIAWYFTFFYLLGPPWIDKERGAEELACGESEEEVVSSSESVSSNASSEHSASEVITGQLSAKERFCFIAGLWPYMVPLFLVYAAEYTIQAGFWAAMGFPVTNRSSRHAWYKWANFTYQIGVFISRSSFVLICKSRKILWLGGILQVIMVGFFGAAATTPFGDWWLIAPALFVGFLGGGVYVGAFTLISQEQDPAFVELALSSASVADTFGIITANILGLIVQGCVFGQMKVLDTRPDFTCGYEIWAHMNRTAAAAPVYKAHCFPGVKG